MTLVEFEEKIAEYEAQLVIIAESRWFDIMLMHSIKWKGSNVLTSWIVQGFKEEDIDALVNAQSIYINDNFK
jgi:hypothetical protein